MVNSKFQTICFTKKAEEIATAYVAQNNVSFNKAVNELIEKYGEVKENEQKK